MAPVYDKDGSSVYRRNDWYVESGGSAYPVQRAYVKVGGSLYQYFGGGAPLCHSSYGLQPHGLPDVSHWCG